MAAMKFERIAIGGTAMTPLAGLLVEKGTPGFTFGPQERYLGMRGFPSSALFFEDCVIPEAHLLIKPGGFGSLMDCFNIERCGNATMALGIATGALALLGIAADICIYTNRNMTIEEL